LPGPQGPGIFRICESEASKIGDLSVVDRKQWRYRLAAATTAWMKVARHD
jgi:hypothetical protein